MSSKTLIICPFDFLLLKYKERHEKIEHYIHWKACKYYCVLKCEKWYKHRPKPLAETKVATIFMDLTLQTDGKVIIYKAFCFDVAHGCMNGASNETRTYSLRNGSLVC